VIRSAPSRVTTTGNPEPSAPASRPAAAAPGQASAVQPPFPIGERVRLAERPPYLKSADPMPMLRPPDLIDDGETGLVVELRSLQQRAVRFRRGTFLLATDQLRSAGGAGEPAA